MTVIPTRKSVITINLFVQPKELSSFVSHAGNLLERSVVDPTYDLAEAYDSFRAWMGDDIVDLVFNFLFKVARLDGLVNIELSDFPLQTRVAVEVLKWTEETLLEYLENEYYEYLRQLILKPFSSEEVFAEWTDSLVSLKKQELSAALERALAALSSEEDLDRYLNNLHARKAGNDMMSIFYDGLASLPHTFYEIKKVDEKSWTLLAGKICYGIGSAAAFAAFPGLSAVGAAIDLGEDFMALSMDVQMVLLCQFALRKAGLTESSDFTRNVVNAIAQNTLEGLQQIIDGADPEHVDGQIKDIQKTGNTYRITIHNGGETRTAYRVVAVFDKTYITYELLPYIDRDYVLPTYAVYPSDVPWLEIDPGASSVIEIELPEKTSRLSLDLLGKTASGVYGLDSVYTLMEKEGFFRRAFSWISACFGSSGEFRVYDSEGRVTGLVNGAIKEEIPNSIYDPVSKSFMAYSPSFGGEDFSSYRYCVVSTTPTSSAATARARDAGAYVLNICLGENTQETSFHANNYVTGPAEEHQYTIDWETLAKGEEGVTFQLDENGDGIPEIIITAGSSLEAGNTPEGLNIRVEFPSTEVAVTFNEVTSAGNTFVSTTESLPTAAQQQGIEFISPAYQFTSTADYAGDITVEVSYDDSSLTATEEKALALFKIAEDGAATDITTGLDTERDRITGETDSFSSFVLGFFTLEDTLLTPSGWHMIALPGELCTPCTNGVCGDLICALGDNLDPCFIFHYDPGVGGYVMAPPPENVCYHAGMGFWTRTYEGDVTIDAELEVPTEAVEVPLGDGWNQIGNPFTFSVSIDALRVRCDETELSLLDAQAQGWLSAYLFGYDTASGGYMMLDPTSGCLQPWSGYWMRIYRDDCVLIIPPTECSGSSTAGHPLSVKELQARGLELPPPPPNDLMNLDVKEVLAGLTVRNVPNPIRSEHTTTFKVEGKGAELVQAIRVDIYDQAGKRVFTQDINAKELEWHTENDMGELLANGVYLYQVWVKIADSWYPTGVHKLAVVR